MAESRVVTLLKASQEAMLLAIELYNKPKNRYRFESFAMLALNAWELALKARWLEYNKNKEASLYVKAHRTLKGKTMSKKLYIKKSKSGNPLTYGVGAVKQKLVEVRLLDDNISKNLDVLIDFRDQATHYYLKDAGLKITLQDVFMACVRNYITYLREWRPQRVMRINMPLFTLSFVDDYASRNRNSVPLEVQLMVKFISNMVENQVNSKYEVAIKADLKFSRETSKDTIKAVLSNDPKALSVVFSDSQFFEKYPLTFHDLVELCKERYADFKQDNHFYAVKRKLEAVAKYSAPRSLDPKNPKSKTKKYYSNAIFTRLDEVYTLRK